MAAQPRLIFAAVAVKDLARSKASFGERGFECGFECGPAEIERAGS